MIKGKKHRKERGTSLIEMIVSIAIIGIIYSIYFLNYRNIEKDLALERSAYKTAQYFRVALEKTLAAEKPEGEENLPQGYGIYIKRQGYGPNATYTVSLYVDKKNTEEYYDSNDDILDNLSLEPGVKVNDIIVSPPFQDELSINFKIPLPRIKISARVGASTHEKDNITIILTNSSKTKKIHVNKSGLIYVE